MLLQAYLDDSGSEPEAPNFVLAGFLANVGQWKRFSNAWKLKLEAEPAIDYFKMHEAMSLRGEFQGMPSSLRDQKVFDLAQTAHDHIEARIDCVMPRLEFEEWVRPNAPIPEMRDPYFTCFYALVMNVNSLHKRIGLRDLSLDFIFDEQGDVGKQAVGWWDAMKALVPPGRRALLGNPPIFRNDRKFLPLQAADLYAWIIRDRLQPKDQEMLPKAVLRLFHDKFPVQKYLGPDYLLGLGAAQLVAGARLKGVL